jgi:large repetitive protein
VTVNCATANGTATAGSDYTSTSGTVTFAPGETTKTITVVVKGDKEKESNETFFVDLFGASSNASIVDAQGIGTIVDDDNRR